jgi:3-deoxy-D-manno-octulosonate 8-phosphate phosphatase (KDO 8-P phosphatase)
MTTQVPPGAADVRLLILDVDGVLNDGRLWYGPDGELVKPFHSRDGFGIRLLLREGVQVAILSARRSAPLERRLADLHIRHAVLGRDDKRTGLDMLLRATGVAPEEAASMGDDVLDLPVMRRVGLPIAVRDAHPLVRAEAAWVTQHPGGGGAVREVADALLEARGRLRAACEALLAEDLT